MFPTDVAGILPILKLKAYDLRLYNLFMLSQISTVFANVGYLFISTGF